MQTSVDHLKVQIPSIDLRLLKVLGIIRAKDGAASTHFSTYIHVQTGAPGRPRSHDTLSLALRERASRSPQCSELPFKQSLWAQARHKERPHSLSCSGLIWRRSAAQISDLNPTSHLLSQLFSSLRPLELLQQVQGGALARHPQATQ